MFGYGTGAGYSARDSLPLIEIGSFAAPQPDSSEFIGSASGVYFANTVFRAFSNVPGPSPEPGDNSVTGAEAPLDPGLVHSHLVATQKPRDQVQTTANVIDPDTIRKDTEGDACWAGTYRYDVDVPGLGLAPPPATAKRLLMSYFQHWHPFFPFLHGPSFFHALNHFYGQETGANMRSGTKDAEAHGRLCRAITFQCVFNIAAWTHEHDQLPPCSRIQSNNVLVNALGTVSDGHDMSSLQAMLAAVLFLTTRMSLRAASTVHGMLTRNLYHSGYHRCPYRYVQLPHDVCDIRKRIFWAAYVLDRQLSQALGHPTAFRDSEIDVCIPGMVELHQPVRSQDNREDVQAHLPKGFTPQHRTADFNDVENGSADQDHTAQGQDISIQSPAHDRRPNSKENTGEYVLGYLVTYSRLLGKVLDVFHRSIHKRDITWTKVLEITSQAHSWWNSLPVTLQEGIDTPQTESRPSFSVVLSVLYHYIVILIHRPFLSLPNNRTDFQYSLQTALGASRSIIQRLQSCTLTQKQDKLILCWPPTLSAVWMAGLVVALAGRADLYPSQKAIWNLDQCLTLLEAMSPRWNSACHCRSGLSMLRLKLSVRSEQRSKETQPNISDPQPVAATGISYGLPTGLRDLRAPKRRRVDNELADQPQSSTRPTFQPQTVNLNQESPDTQLWQPVLPYIGPDFGFDADMLGTGGSLSGPGFDATGSNADPVALFSTLAWDAYINGLEDRYNL